jgi:organic hydroperoxide reductase OsmC/OhrA
MRKRLLVIGIVVIAAGATAVVMAQQPHGGAAGQNPGQMFQMIHAGCNAQPGSHVPKHLATVLELTDAQVSDMNTIAVDACAAMQQFHERMRNVLTDEQRSKAEAMFKQHGHVAGMSWFRRLHGE